MNKAGMFSRIVRMGLTDETPQERRDEIKLMNSIAFHSSIASFVFTPLFTFVVPQHWPFTILGGFTNTVVMGCVILLNDMQRYRLAKTAFTVVPAIIIILLTAYFGVAANFHYLSLTSFFALVLIFKNQRLEDIVMGMLFISLIIVGLMVVYTMEESISVVSETELAHLRLLVFTLNTTLIIILSVVFYKWTQSRQRTIRTTFTQVSKGANILNTISTNVVDGIFKSSPERGFEYVNRSFALLFGYESEKEIMQVFPEKLYYSITDRDVLIDRLRSERSVSNMLFHYRRKDDTDFWGRLSCTLIDEGGEEFIVGTITDVTQQQRQDDILKESEERLREAQRIAKLGNWQFNTATKELVWSAECIRIHGYDPSGEPEPFESWVNRLESVNESFLETLVAKAMMTHEAVEFGSWYTTPEGERKYLVYICRYQRAIGRKDSMWYGTAQDQTERKLAELEILTTQRFYQSLLDNIPIEAVITDENGVYEYISKSAIGDEKLRSWMIGKTNYDYAAYRNLPMALAEHRHAIIRQVAGSGQAQRFEEKMKTRDGQDSYHIRNIFPIEITEGGNKHRSAVVAYSFDINDIKKAQLELEQKNLELTVLNQELDRFVYSVSHDLRAPIASVLGLINLAQDAGSVEEIRELLMMQREALDRLDGYIREVIDYSRNKRLGVRREEVRIGAVVDKCLAELAFIPQYARVKFIREIEDDACVVSDMMRVRIVVNNLLSNALKYSDGAKEQSWVRLAAKRIDGGVQIVIDDNGLGIPAMYIDRIWDMFFRATSEGSGSGLGLYILRESLQVLGGEITVSSVEGEGSTFTVTLPDYPESVSSDHP